MTQIQTGWKAVERQVGEYSIRYSSVQSVVPPLVLLHSVCSVYSVVPLRNFDHRMHGIHGIKPDWSASDAFHSVQSVHSVVQIVQTYLTTDDTDTNRIEGSGRQVRVVFHPVFICAICGSSSGLSALCVFRVLCGSSPEFGPRNTRRSLRYSRSVFTLHSSPVLRKSPGGRYRWWHSPRRAGRCMSRA